ncbi:MAG TPA: LLM class flavin-dependent oxidoreductase [bacterium]|nr:LLM class flavin-dependent oxidoreductase [bacterium]
MALALGVLLNAEYPVGELVELARLSEDLGYDQIWYTDIRMFRECYLGCAAIAANTRRAQIGPGVTDPYSRHPAVTASTIATLDEMSGGRALLGLGVGSTGFRELGIRAVQPVTALRESVALIRGLLRGEEITVKGKVISLNAGRLQFRPVRSHVPMYFATQGARITELAGEVADGIMIPNTVLPSAVDFFLDGIRRGAEKAGRPLAGLDIALRFEACVSDDQAEAEAVMRGRVAMRVAAGYGHWDYLERLGIALPQAFVDIAAAGDLRRAAEAAHLLPPEAVDRMVLAGDPVHVAGQLTSAMRPGITRVIVRPHAPRGRSVGDVLRRFVTDVVPRVAAAVH